METHIHPNWFIKFLYRRKIIFCVLFVFFNSSSYCQSDSVKVFVVEPNMIVKDIMSWLYYQRDHLSWSSEYATLDTASKIISKHYFLEELTTGRYLPVKIKKPDALCYQLYKLDKTADKDIVSAIKDMASKELQYYKMEGLVLPDFKFVDLNGTVYNKETTRDKLIVLNCWFVRCKPCVEEMPSLNLLVKKFTKRKDILFIALARDNADDIRKFLQTNNFNYAIVPDEEEYLNNTLKIIGYPTQVVINRKGMIVKIIESNKIKELTDVLNKEINN